MIGQAFAADCDASRALELAAGRVFELDLAAARSTLDGIAEGFECGAVEPDQLATWWLLVGAVETFEGNAEAAQEALVAARAADPERWVAELGDELRTTWENAHPGPGEATIKLVPPPKGYEVRIDGKVVGDRLVVRPGAHLVQLRGGDAGWGKIVRAAANESLTLSHALPERVVEVASPVEAPTPASSRLLGLHLGLGFAGAFGEAIDAGALREPGAKVGPIVEAGILVRPGPVWARAAVGAELPIGGRYVYVDESSDTAHAWRIGPALHAAGGVTLAERYDVGALVGMQLPGRLPVRAVASVDAARGLRVELRAGVNVGTPTAVEGSVDERSLRLEPAFGALATWTP